MLEKKLYPEQAFQVILFYSIILLRHFRAKDQENVRRCGSLQHSNSTSFLRSKYESIHSFDVTERCLVRVCLVFY